MEKPWDYKATPLTNKIEDRFISTIEPITHGETICLEHAREIERRMRAAEEILKLTVDCIVLPPQIAEIINTHLAAGEGE